MLREALDRIRETRENHGMSYMLRRLGQKAAQQYLGTYDRRRKREQTPEEELRRQRENQPAAGLISVVIPVWNTDPGMLTALMDPLENQTYADFEVILYDGAGTRAETVTDGAFTLTLKPNAVLRFTLAPAPLTPDIGYEYGWYAAEE